MKLKHFIFLAMFLPTLFSFSQKLKYENIKKEVLFYEFNPQRSGIYTLDYKHNLYFYDVNKEKNSQIGENGQFNPDLKYAYGRTNPMFCTATGFLYIVCSDCIYKIKDLQIAEKIPYLYELASGSAILEEIYDGTADKKKKAFNKALEEFEGKTAYVLLEDLYILKLKDGSSVAFYNNHLDKVLTEENKKKIEGLDKENIIWPTDTSYYRQDIGKKQTINYFNNKAITIKEKAYNPKIFRPIMSFGPASRWYKIKVLAWSKQIVLKDKIRRSSRMGTRGNEFGNITPGKSDGWNCNLYESIPNSKYITDNKNAVYLLFFFGNERNLIKISTDPIKK